MDINSYKPHYAGLSGRHLISLADYSSEEIYEILHTARLLKRKQAVGERQTSLLSKEIMLITKTAFSGMKVASEIAIKQLCGTSIIMPLGGAQVEALTADVDFLPAIARYGVDAIAVSTDDRADAQLIKSHSPVPVIDANSVYSPQIALAALLTCWEKIGKLKDVKITAIGGAPHCEELLRGAVKCGMKITSVCPSDVAPTQEFIDSHAIYGTILHTDDIEEGVLGANAIFRSAKETLPEEYKLSYRIAERAAENFIFLHPMPIDRQTETDDVCDGANSAVLDMAENLLHVKKAILALTVGKNINL